MDVPEPVLVGNATAPSGLSPRVAGSTPPNGSVHAVPFVYAETIFLESWPDCLSVTPCPTILTTPAATTLLSHLGHGSMTECTACGGDYRTRPPGSLSRGRPPYLHRIGISDSWNPASSWRGTVKSTNEPRAVPSAKA